MPVESRGSSAAHAASVLQAILDTTVDGLITIDDQGRILSFNRACEHIFGHRADEVLGRNVSCLMPDPYRDEHDNYLREYREGGPPRIIGQGREVRGLRRDGSTFPLDLAVAEVQVDGMTIYSGIVRDITARKQAEAKILLQNEELGRFAYMASHDLKEPLRSIESFAEILSLDYEDQLDDQGREYLSILMSAASRLRAVVNDVLDYSRLETDDAAHVEIDAADILRQLREENRDMLESTGGTIKWAELPLLTGDRVRFYRLMQNLLSNALKYCPQERSPQISVSATRRGEFWEFRVSDNGIGIDPEYRAVIFEMFKRLHTRDAYVGTGIGLAICRRIVESWNGEIWVESSAPNGSVFCFTIPATTGIVPDVGT